MIKNKLFSMGIAGEYRWDEWPVPVNTMGPCCFWPAQPLAI